MKVVISRTYGKNETRGSLFVLDGHDLLFRCKTIELPNLGNQHNISCIPEDIYDCIKYDSPTKGKCFHVLNVQNRDSILIHKGNYVAGSHIDSKGCILPGNYFSNINEDGFIDVAESTKALEMLLSLLPDSFKLYVL
jgi:hypothetical protein